jgi:hypothetical protein
MSMRRFSPLLLFSLILILAACGGLTPAATPHPTDTVRLRPTNTPPPTATIFVTATLPEEEVVRKGDPLLAKIGDYFSTSGACAACHMNQTDDAGNDVSIDAAWRASIMANSARDPYWQATVKAEVSELPDLAETIQNTCTRCHMPMAQFTAEVAGENGVVFGADGFVNPDSSLHAFAMDGISCAVCHQIRSDNLGTQDSYSGGFQIDTQLRAPDRVIFGPFEIAADQAGIMAGASGYQPVQSAHMAESELCATCHVLYTPYIDALGQVAGDFPEQMTYLEYYYSSFRNRDTCQGCHMPEAEGGVKISLTSETLRSPFSQHTFVGGNAYILKMLDQYGEELGVTASSEHFAAGVERTVAQLQNDTATLKLEKPQRVGARVSAEAALTVLAGHKFPTGFPSRRAWLHVTLTDGAGNLVFESGGTNPDGSIVGNDNDADPAQFEQHYQAIVQPEQVQIYEAILRDTENHVTTDLLRAAGYLKDNRLAPEGFEKAAPYEDFAVRGGARDDVDFDGGGDRVLIAINTGEASSPFTLTVELLYQSIGFRWMENLKAYADQTEVADFVRFTGGLPNFPVVIASDSVTLE